MTSGVAIPPWASSMFCFKLLFIYIPCQRSNPDPYACKTCALPLLLAPVGFCCFQVNNSNFVIENFENVKMLIKENFETF